MAKNPNFSLRALAKKTKSSSAALSEILSGKRSLSEKRALTLTQFLSNSSQKSKLLQRSFEASGQFRKLKNHEAKYIEELLPNELFDLLADWRNFAVMSLMRAESVPVRSASQFVSKRLNLTEADAGATIKRLLDSGLVASRSNTFSVTGKVFRSPDDYPKNLIDQRVAEGLRNAKIAMEDVNKWHRCVFSTITADVTRLAEAMGMIEDFVKRLSVFLSSGRGTEVFELSVNLFSMTKTDGNADLEASP